MKINADQKYVFKSREHQRFDELKVESKAEADWKMKWIMKRPVVRWTLTWEKFKLSNPVGHEPEA